MAEVTLHEARSLCDKFSVLNHRDRLWFVAEAVRAGKSQPTATKPIYLLRFSGLHAHFYFCVTACSLLLCLSAKRLHATVSRHCRGEDIAVPAKLRPPSALKQEMIAWLRVYIDTHCAKMPNSDILMMPARTTIPELYNHYLQDRPEGSRPPLKLSTMYSVLDEHFPKVHYPRVTGLGKCLQCFNLKAAVRRPGRALLLSCRISCRSCTLTTQRSLLNVRPTAFGSRSLASTPTVSLVSLPTVRATYHTQMGPEPHT